jgi:hypothetical protein
MQSYRLACLNIILRNKEDLDDDVPEIDRTRRRSCCTGDRRCAAIGPSARLSHRLRNPSVFVRRLACRDTLRSGARWNREGPRNPFHPRHSQTSI